MTVRARGLGNWTWPVALFVLTFAITFVAGVPAASLLRTMQSAGLDVRADQSAGTLWRGAFSGARVANLAVGSIEYSVSPFAFSPNGLHLRWSSTGPGVRTNGVLSPGLGSHASLAGVTARIDAAVLSLPVPVTGEVEVQVAEAEFDGQACRHLDGGLTVTGVAALPERPPVRMSGPLLCDNGAVAGLLTGTIGPYPAALNLASAGLDAIDVALTLSDVPTDFGALLTTFGFSEQGGDYELGQTLRLQ